MIDARIHAFPAAAMALVTFGVWLRLFAIRIAEMQRERIHPQSVALSAQASAIFRDTRAADNFRNLFELPVLFYAALLFGGWLAIQTPAFVVLAWLFVALRAVHSLIQCTYNKVMHRFYAYLASAATLWALWGVIAWRLLVQ